MNIFRDLYIRGEADQLSATVDEIERSLNSGWARDKTTEQSLREMGITAKSTYCFTCKSQDRRPAATVFLTEKEAGTLYVSNIAPQSRRDLLREEYNGILTEFCESFVRPSVARTRAAVEMTDTEAELEHWLSPRAAEKLRSFSMAANRSTGSSHPSDQERWFDFVVTAHREGGHLDASTLRRWLEEIEGWAPEVADQLAGEYESNLQLLTFLDGRRRSA